MLFTTLRQPPSTRCLRHYPTSFTSFRRNMAVVHQVAQSGFGTGNELYDRARPSYQPAALSHIRSNIKGAPPFNILEIGAGTGIFTRALLAHPEWSSSVRQLKAVEPSEGMRSIFTKTVTDERASCAEGTFDSTGVEDGWADLVVIAQAFHWCPDFDKAAAEFARILKPEGVVTLIWNLEDREAAEWVAHLRDAYEKFEQGTPQFRLGLWRVVFSTPSYTEYFHPPETEQWKFALPTTREGVHNRILSKSYIAVLSQEHKGEVIRELDVVLDSKAGMKFIDEEKGIFEWPYSTVAVTCRRK